MSTPTLLSLFPKPEDLLALTPEDLGGVIIEIMPPLLQNGVFSPATLTYPLQHNAAYMSGDQRAVELAITEAVCWLVTQGLLVPDPRQQGPGIYLMTRRAKRLHSRIDVDAFRKGRILPDDLLPTLFAEKVVPLFRRGDHDIAVFQAFKEVEVAVRNVANAKGAGYSNSDFGSSLMRKAFHPENGPLSDQSQIYSEREAEMHIFSGAIGHAKNPPSHRDYAITAQQAARLIVFASHLLDIVDQRG
jgi:hypothetical protein